MLKAIHGVSHFMTQSIHAAAPQFVKKGCPEITVSDIPFLS